jgi:uroporphyrinogen-III synthase
MITRLEGVRVVVTRDREQAGELNARLRRRGAIPIAYPCIAIVPPASTAGLDAAVRAAADGCFDRLVLTSVNSVLAVRRRLDALGLRLPVLPAAAVGPSTADAARRWLGVAVRYVPDTFLADELAAGIGVTSQDRILLPQSNIAGESLADALERWGARVTRVEAYRTVRGCGGVRLRSLLAAGSVDAISLASASAARHLAGRLREEGGSPRDLAGVAVACIGSRTEAVALRHDIPVTTVAGTQDLGGLIIALERALELKLERMVWS